jgi:UDP-N-acetylmuramoyl-tripeptide--D-alanyl-D-alanine ligase
VQFLLTELAAAVDGTIAGGDDPPLADRSVVDVSIDSRTITAGQLFVPLVAERDGHEFIDGALAKGAEAYLAARSWAGSVGDRTGSVAPSGDGGLRAVAVLVDDTATALTTIGKLARSRMDGAVIGITGSVGKTSTKDLALAACSSRAVSASLASFNNEIGVPLTLANAADDAEVVIVEMGARGIGHIAELCAVASPTVGVVTRVALAHSELFGSLEGVATAKGELVEALPSDGVAVLNADDPLVAAMAERTSASVVTYGTGSADVRIGDVEVDRLLRPHFTIESPWGTAALTLEVRGAHMALNAGAALAAAVASGVAFDDAIEGLRSARLSPWRMEVAESRSGLLVLNDAYNANPTSVRAALEALADAPAERRIAVLGAMAELGAEGPAEHLAVAAEAVAAGVRVIAVAAPAYGPDVEHVADLDQALTAVGECGAGDAVLVKGSRVAGLEKLAAGLLGR